MTNEETYGDEEIDAMEKEALAIHARLQEQFATLWDHRYELSNQKGPASQEELAEVDQYQADQKRAFDLFTKVHEARSGR